MAVGTSSDSTWAGENGTRPVARNPPLQCSGLKEVSHILAIKTRENVLADFYFLRITLRASLTGANTPTSSGCKRWVVCGKETNDQNMLLQWAPGWCRNDDHQRNGKTGALSVRCDMDSNNNLLNHNKKFLTSILPDVEIAAAGPPFIHSLGWDWNDPMISTYEILWLVLCVYWWWGQMQPWRGWKFSL